MPMPKRIYAKRAQDNACALLRFSSNNTHLLPAVMFSLELSISNHGAAIAGLPGVFVIACCLEVATTQQVLLLTYVG